MPTLPTFKKERDPKGSSAETLGKQLVLDSRTKFMTTTIDKAMVTCIRRLW